jgi:ubiquinone/menaquinone biosynthesis C-methylase UbiE
MHPRLLYGLSLLRSSLFTIEGMMIPMADFLASRRVPRLPITDLSLLLRVRRSLFRLLRDDVRRIEAGFYPATVLACSEPLRDPLTHFLRLPSLFREAMAFSRRRHARKTKEFDAEAQAELLSLPDYYRRNFHFQKSGYLSRDSAAIYDHQVELLFAGAADAMRRMTIAPLKRHFGMSQGRGLRFLELGCGTGSGTMFMNMAFPEAEILAMDFSKAYLELARQRVRSRKVIFREGAGEQIPFRAGAFDAVYSVFLFHELPLDVRERVLVECGRVLKKSGLFVMVDSLQFGDVPGLERPLKRFPAEFHEPFYPNYLRNPMEQQLERHGYEVRLSETGFFAKVIAAIPKKAVRRRRHA